VIRWLSSDAQQLVNKNHGILKRFLGNRVARAGAALVITSSALYLYFSKLDETKKEQRRLSMQPEDYGTPKLGAPFVLTDHSGKTFDSSTELKGKHAILYFGFTHCPDICPEELDKLGKIIDTVKAKSSEINLVPIFVSCDPRRDTPAIITEYLKDFHPKIVGLTVNEGGDTEPLQKMAKSFRVYYRPAKTGENDYLLDHSIFYYLLVDGEFVKVYGRSMTSDEIANDILTLKSSSSSK
jgi:protein SCO1/2